MKPLSEQEAIKKLNRGEPLSGLVIQTKVGMAFAFMSMANQRRNQNGKVR